MNCPKCKQGPSGVVDSREKDHGKWRRRECLTCGHRWNTYEVLEPLVRQYEEVQGMLTEIHEKTKPFARDL